MNPNPEDLEDLSVQVKSRKKNLWDEEPGDHPGADPHFEGAVSMIGALAESSSPAENHPEDLMKTRPPLSSEQSLIPPFEGAAAKQNGIPPLKRTTGMSMHEQDGTLEHGHPPQPLTAAPLKERFSEDSSRKLEQVPQQLQSQKDLQTPSEDLNKLSHQTPSRTTKELSPTQLGLEKILDQGKINFERREYEDCIQAMNEVLRQDPNRWEAASLLGEAQSKWEEQRAERELANYIKITRKEAVNLFDRGQYAECVSKFKFLCKALPDDRTLRVYLEVSQEEAKKKELFGPGKSVPSRDHLQPGPQRASAPERRLPELQLLQKQAPSLKTEVTVADQDEPNPAIEAYSNSKRKRALVIVIVLGVVTLIIGALLGWWLTSGASKDVTSAEIQSSPVGADVFLDGELKGKTPVYLQALPVRNYQLHIEKKGYAPLTQKIAVEKGHPSQISVQLQSLTSAPMTEANLQQQAKTLIDQGDLLEAGQKLQAKMKKGSSATKPGNAEFQGKIQDLHQQISVALGSANYFPPNSGNAFDLIQRLNALSPGDSFAKEKLEQIHHDLFNQAHRKYQAKDLEGAKAILHQLQAHFPETADFKNLRETLNAEEVKQLEARNSWIQKAEAALGVGRYISPADDNVVVYCNRVLSLDPQNQRLLSLKKEAFSKAASQAKDWILKGKYDDARALYSLLLQFSKSENPFPFDGQQLKTEIEKLEFHSNAVIHDHALGNCIGTLRVNGYEIVYIPSVDSKDGFTHKLTEIVDIEPGDKLKIHFRNRTFRFQINSAKSKQEGEARIIVLYEYLSRMKSQAK